MIYFIERPDGIIKIGTTIRLTQRLKAIRSQHGRGCQVLAVMEGSFADEAALHDRFSNLRTEGEWFVRHASLTEFIEAEGRTWDGTDEAGSLASVKLHIDVIEAARIVTAYTGESMTDMLSDILGPILAKMEHDEVTRRAKGTKPKGSKH